MPAGASTGKVLKSANPGTIQNKFLVGYQGWFTCGGDGPPIGEGHHGWLHWVNEPIPPPSNGRPNTDLWPDTSAYDPSELYEIAGLAHRDGSPAKVFSSRDPRTVRRHFRWMAEHGVDGAFLQRFVGQVDPEEAGNRDERFGGTRRLRDEVGRRVREAAEAEGRVWAIMYDVSSVAAADIVRIVARDMAHLQRDERIFDSPAYLRERGRPVVGVWGLGLADSPVSPATARTVYGALRAAAAQDLYLFAGVPAHWRTPGAGDAHGDPAWAALWLGTGGAVDALSPWSVGRYGSEAEVARWAAERWGEDAALVARHNEGVAAGGAGRRVDYVPVVLPGGSGFNLSQGKWAFNGIKRNGGKFLWAQIFHAARLQGVTSMYGAMWDEYDEGTAFLPVVEKKRLLPESEKWPFLALDEDGYDLPSDWFMRVAGFAAEGLRGERRIHDAFPSKELQDYWGTRPRYEPDATAAAASGAARQASVAGASSAGADAGAEAEAGQRAREAKAQYEAWAEEQRRKEAEGEEAPPPAYSLEAEADGADTAPVAQQQQLAPVPQQQQQQPAPVAQQPPQTGVDALAGDLARARIGAEAPLAQQGRQDSGSQVQTQGYARPGVERPPLHPAHPQALRVGSADAGGGGAGGRPRPRTSEPLDQPALRPGSVPAGAGAGASLFGLGRVASPEVQGQGQGKGQWPPKEWNVRTHRYALPTSGSASASASPAGSGMGNSPPHQVHAGSSGTGYPARGEHQHTGGPASPASSSYPGQAAQQVYAGPSAGSGYPAPGAMQHAQHTGGSSGSSSPYPTHATPQPQWQQQQNTCGATAAAAAPYPPAQAAPYQTHGPYEPPRQQQQHTGGSGSSSQASYHPPSGDPPYQAGAPRPASAYPGQVAAAGYDNNSSFEPSVSAHPSSSYSQQTSLRPSTSVSARPSSPLYLSAASSAHNPFRPTTPGSASYPPSNSSYGTPQSPHGGPQLGRHPTLAARPDSARPTTPGYGAAHPHLGPMGPPPQPSYSNQFPSPDNGPPASYPGSSYNPPHALPSPDISGPSFPGSSPYASYQPPPGPPPGHQSPPPSGSYASLPAPHAPHAPYASPAGPPPHGAGSPPFPGPGPSFPHAGPDAGYSYQQPPFPGADYSPQPDVYSNYAQPHAAWGPGGHPPPMPHRPGSQPMAYGQPVSYGGAGPSFPSPSAAPPPPGAMGYAINSVDKIGRRTREQVEEAVDRLADSGAKLLHKFL
ncbi:hypothetical protein GGX14DRAFT_658206 [Mycena pura]|uniref:Xylosidase/arabinosidase n=1 Tax=Mycena pura TaxID=153505 RepID=A0AAD6YM65_9AGAR|nr:hypothetical protein GGX14DRAFT_658206 [Mycena pura]